MTNRAALAILFVGMLAPCGGAQSAADSAELANGTKFMAELSASLDSKKAKTGDSVVAQVTEAVKIDGKTVIPKGAKIIGHVTQALARAKGDPDSALAIQFDKAVLKKGPEIPLSAWIRAMAAEPRSSFQPGPEQNTLAGTPGAGSSPMSGRGGMPPGNSSPGAAPGTAPKGESDAGVGSSTDEKTAGGSAGLSTAGQLTPNSQGVFGLDGLHLATDASSASQGSLITSSAKSVHLDSGTKLLLVSATAVSGTPEK